MPAAPAALGPAAAPPTPRTLPNLEPAWNGLEAACALLTRPPERHPSRGGGPGRGRPGRHPRAAHREMGGHGGRHPGRRGAGLPGYTAFAHHEAPTEVAKATPPPVAPPPAPPAPAQPAPPTGATGPTVAIVAPPSPVPVAAPDAGLVAAAPASGTAPAAGTSGGTSGTAVAVAAPAVTPRPEAVAAPKGAPEKRVERPAPQDKPEPRPTPALAAEDTGGPKPHGNFDALMAQGRSLEQHDKAGKALGAFTQAIAPSSPPPRRPGSARPTVCSTWRRTTRPSRRTGRRSATPLATARPSCSWRRFTGVRASGTTRSRPTRPTSPKTQADPMPRWPGAT